MGNDFIKKEKYSIGDLLEIMSLLRSENGCPWDREQTHLSIRKNFIEETYEAVEAIDCNDPEMLREELGDVLLQVVFHTQMEKENGNFDFDDICDGICQKLIIRHPHIFGEEELSSSKAVANRWEEIKKETKGQKSGSETLIAVPKQLPALMRCDKLLHRAEKAAGTKICSEKAFDMLDENVFELRKAEKENRDLIKEKMGELLFSAVMAARAIGLEPEECLDASSEKFIRHFTEMEKIAKEQGKALSEMEEEIFSQGKGQKTNQ